jgi:hypothetical protein
VLTHITGLDVHHLACERATDGLGVSAHATCALCVHILCIGPHGKHIQPVHAHVAASLQVSSWRRWKQQHEFGCCGCILQGGAPGAVGTAGSKRARPTGDYVPMESRTPQLSSSCLAALCNAVLEDRLLPNWQEDAAGAAAVDADMMGLPAADSSDASHSQDSHSGARIAAGDSCDQKQQRLVRDARFRAFVLRSCARHLEGARRGATHTLLVSGASGEAAREWQLLAPALFRVAKVSQLTASYVHVILSLTNMNCWCQRLCTNAFLCMQNCSCRPS